MASNTAYSQEHAFLNPNQSLVNLNPSFAGSNGFIRNQSSYRSSLNSNYSNYTASNSFDAYLKPLKAGIAVSALRNNIADISIHNSFSLSYAQYFSILKGQLKLVPSLKLGSEERSTNLPDTWLPLGSVNQTPAKINYLNVSAGFLATYKNKLYAGFSIATLNRQSNNVFLSNRIIDYHVSYNLKFSNNLQMQFFGRFQTNVGYTSHNLAANALLYKHFLVGVGIGRNNLSTFNLGYRNNYFTLLAGCDVQKRRPWESYYARSFELHASFNLRNKLLRETITSFET